MRKTILTCAVLVSCWAGTALANTGLQQVADDTVNTKQRAQAFAALEPSLPPDPGMAGMVSLVGVDLDGDGVRDDVQRKIAARYPNAPSKRAALLQLTNAITTSMLNYHQELMDKKDISVTGEEISRAAACTTFQNVTPGFSLKELEQWIANTPERQLAYSALNDYLAVNGDFYNYAVEGAANCDSSYYQQLVR
ncbi:hypothetical protein GBN23_14535 [Plesiomonas shigelloides]|uniref:hypothetical protein n=1 Tax=Plesiomonas shigelloides TaxID=703 RepID=UPI001261D8AA|nr:hypothetical protein [Plesiomonas shigelloides]KAB7674182.1 hypothetical protein GBN23_14535 [Plesiomonas shigelloides]